MGRIVITLEEYLRKRNISKNKLCYGAELQRTQLQNYCKNKVARIDLYVLERICGFLDCKLEDIMHYECQQERKNEETHFTLSDEHQPGNTRK